MNPIIPKTFDFSSIEGLSMNQLSQHYKLYEGYIKNINLIFRKLSEESFKGSNTTYSPYRSLKLGETYALNGVKLHQLYFDNLGGYKNIPYGNLLQKLIEDFGSFDIFKKDFLNSGQSSRGWVVCAYDFLDSKIRNYVCDTHSEGGIWNTAPILVLDVYEHAYMIDYGINRNQYLDVFLKNINWEVCENRFNHIIKSTKVHQPTPYPIPMPYFIS